MAAEVFFASTLAAVGLAYVWLLHRARCGVWFGAPYVRDPDAIGLPPAVCGWLLRKLTVDRDDLTSTLLDLVSRRVVKLKRTDEDGRLVELIPRDPGTAALRYVLVLDRGRAVELWPHERALLGLLFGQVGAGRPMLTMDAIREFARREPERFATSLSECAQKTIETASELGIPTDRRAFDNLDIAVWFVLVVTLDGLFGSLMTGNIVFIAVAILMAVLMIVHLRLLVVPPPEARDAYVACLGLRRFLRDSLATAKSLRPEAVELWERYLVYATAFNMAKDVERALQVPRLHAVRSALGLDSPFWTPSDTAIASNSPTRAFERMMEDEQAPAAAGPPPR
ncbi:MAG: hypothetical protein V2J16_11625 [Thermoleophilia bacterium]|jgi:hypothetical protein|nr:hypothetical protein [Thermoleophilia bacterium]